MTRVEIEYCVPCGLLERAVETQETLLREFGRDLDGVRLTPGRGGVFRIRVDDELVRDENDRDGAAPETITEAVRRRVDA